MPLAAAPLFAAAMSDIRHSAVALRTFARDLLCALRVDDDKARDTADILVDGDLLGHTTHGLALLAPYLKELEAGAMTGRGTYEVVHERDAAALWDGRRLPGPWL